MVLGYRPPPLIPYGEGSMMGLSASGPHRQGGQGGIPEQRKDLPRGGHDRRSSDGARTGGDRAWRHGATVTGDPVLWRAEEPADGGRSAGNWAGGERCAGGRDGGCGASVAEDDLGGAAGAGVGLCGRS
jgi:hypothetical protein